MENKGNIVLIGNSGVGKSTLINAVLGEDVAKTSFGGSSGTTQKLDIYENDKIPFRLIDTMGFEPGYFKRKKAIKAVEEWSKSNVNGGNKSINVIWFCIDSNSSKLFDETVNSMLRATKMWKSVPIIAVLTKSYLANEREKNIEMVKNAFAKQKDEYGKKLRGVIPVVALTSGVNDNIIIPQNGITKLIEETNALLPEGIKAAERDITDYKLSRKRKFANTVVSTATSAGVAIGAVPIPFSDALLLEPIEIGEIKAIAKIYGIEDSGLLKTIIEVGTVGVVAKGVISALKAIPGINIAASVLNAVIAGAVVCTLGEVSVSVFEKIYLGEKSVEDIDWVKKLFENRLSDDTGIVGKLKSVTEKISPTSDKKDIIKAILGIFNNKK